MIDREQVLHVARLARLELSEEEVGRMTGELSAILDHIEKISALDLDGVPPTSHVAAVPNPLAPVHGRGPPPRPGGDGPTGRPPDEPRPSLPREVAFANAPSVDDEGFSV